MSKFSRMVAVGCHKHVVDKVVVGSSMIGFPLVIAVSERDLSGIKPGLLSCHSSALTNELPEVSGFFCNQMKTKLI